MASAARTYFDQVFANPDPAGYLASLVGTTPPTMETEWLDFKGMPRPEDVRKIWSKSLSSFGNTEGGVLVWGIDARKDTKTGIDCAGKLRLIDNPQLLKSQLLDSQHQASDPPVSGVEIEAIEYGPEAPKGFVICLIPESQSKPIRADLLDNKPYLIRSGTSSVVPSPSLLRSLFYPQSKSNLQIAVCPTHNLGPQPAFEIRYEVIVSNSGAATARDVRIVVRKEYGLKMDKALGWTIAGHPDGIAFDCPKPLHPGDSSIAIGISHSVEAGQPYTELFKPARHSTRMFWFVVFSADHEAQYFGVSFNGLEMGQGETKSGQPVSVWPD